MPQDERRAELARIFAEMLADSPLEALELAAAIVGDPPGTVKHLVEERKRRCPNCGGAITSSSKRVKDPARRLRYRYCPRCGPIGPVEGQARRPETKVRSERTRASTPGRKDRKVGP